MFRDARIATTVEVLGCGAGRITWPERGGTGWWAYAEPRGARRSVKGTGKILVSTK